MSLIIFVIFSMFSTNVYGEKITVGVEGFNYHPYFSFDRDDKYQGKAREFFNGFVSKNSNYEVVYKKLSINRLNHALSIKTIDLKFPDNPSWEYKLPKIFSLPIFKYQDGVFALKKNIGRDVKKLKSLGLLHGFTLVGFSEHLANNPIELHFISSSKGYSSCFKKLQFDRIDGCYLSKLVGDTFLKDKNLGSIIEFDHSLPIDKSYYYISTIHRKDLIVQINTYINEITWQPNI